MLATVALIIIPHARGVVEMGMAPQILLRVSKRTQLPLLGSRGHNRGKFRSFEILIGFEKSLISTYFEEICCGFMEYLYDALQMFGEMPQ
ncbi:unnamed protein product [Lactuca virosa]|uniref:Uncharacterized protein n=1 Tax=Lactuca virosa TaxID=75947 RepID=A0AAU9MNT2_9ASTR|nr:unnamed protein product [Lactuca virosa]